MPNEHDYDNIGPDSPVEHRDDITATPSEPNTPATAPATAPVAPTPNTPGVIILQWLTYAFWGWLILGLMWLMVTILINAIMGESTSEMVPYAIAASVVLFPIAFVCDLFYRKHEPAKKTGVATVIMVIHAVIFALIGIGTLVASVFIGLNALIEAGEVSGGQMVALLSTLFATLLYAFAFIRTLNPTKGKTLGRLYSYGMLGLTLVLLGLATAGPLITSISARDDVRLEQNLSSVQDGINTYIAENDALPTSLSDVPFRDEDAQALVDDGLVEYTTHEALNDRLGRETKHRYELCVEYKASKNGGSGSSYSYSDVDGYSEYLSTYSHDAGETCYKLQYTNTNYNYDNL